MPDVVSIAEKLAKEDTVVAVAAITTLLEDYSQVNRRDYGDTVNCP